jgi:glycosyltransferase involved in cell wall biosynthesis
MNDIKEPELSVIIPCYNESAVLQVLEPRLRKCLEELHVSWEVIFVDDGSQDSTFQQLAAMHASEPRFKVISLSRNFGHQAALCAGLDRAVGKAVGILDADLQDPPELLRLGLEKLNEGYDVVYGVRRKRKENLFKRGMYSLFYRLLHGVAEVSIPLDSGDFCLMRQRVVTILIALTERNYFLRGLRAWTGFRQFGLEYEREARAAGQTKYRFNRLFRLAVDGVLAFSTVPMRIATIIGFGVVLLSLILTLFVISWRFGHFSFMGHRAAELPGWTAIICLILFLSGIQFIILGVLGEYVGRIYSEVKQRPRWIVREVLGWNETVPN